jgi:hypothetical protein
MLKPDDFKHFDKMNSDFIKFLDNVLDGAGLEIPRNTWITSDWRDLTAEEKLPGGAHTSLHLIGRAVDLHSALLSSSQIGGIADAICLYRYGRQVEYEIEITPGNAHLHIGLFNHDGGLRLITLCTHL